MLHNATIETYWTYWTYLVACVCVCHVLMKYAETNWICHWHPGCEKCPGGFHEKIPSLRWRMERVATSPIHFFCSKKCSCYRLQRFKMISPWYPHRLMHPIAHETSISNYGSSHGSVDGDHPARAGTLAYSKLTSWLIDIPTISYHKPSQSPINIMNNWLEIPTTSPIIYPDIARNRPDIAWNIMKYHHNIPIGWCFILHLNIIKTDENSTTIVHPHPRNLHSDAHRAPGCFRPMSALGIAHRGPLDLTTDLTLEVVVFLDY